jgi:hypothetical protein
MKHYAMKDARVSVDGLGTMLQAGRSRVRVPLRLLNFFFSLYNPSSRTMALGFIQPLTEMSTRNRIIMFLGSKVRRVRRADNLTTICEPSV